MIFFLVGATKKRVFNLLFRLAKGKDLTILWLTGRKGTYSYKNLHFRYESYFSLLKGERKTLRDCILEGKLSEYEFSRAISRDLFIPKKHGDLLYWAYISGEEPSVEGYEEFKRKVLELKQKEKFIDWIDIEDFSFEEDALVFEDMDEYHIRVLRALFKCAERHRKKLFVLLLKTQRQDLVKYFSYAQRNVEVLTFQSPQSIIDFPYELISTRDLLERITEREERWTIYAWSRKDLFVWAKELLKRKVPVGVYGDYKGERVFLSLPTKAVRTQRAFFCACPFPESLPYYIKAMSKAKEVFLAKEDLPYWGFLTSRHHTRSGF